MNTEQTIIKVHSLKLISVQGSVMFEDGSRSLDRLSILQYRQDGNDSENI